MYLGGDAVIADEEVLFIIPRECALLSRDTRRALDSAIGPARLRTQGEQRSYVIAGDENRLRVLSSPISAQGLSKRENR